MNDRLRRNPIFKAPKPDLKEKTMFRMQKNKIDTTRSSFFRLYISNDQIEVFINTILEWTQDLSKPKFRDLMVIQTQAKDSFVVVLQTIGSQKKNLFTNAFGLQNVEIPEDLKGERSLDNYEGQIDRNTDIYFRPQRIGDEEDLQDAFTEMCNLFGIQYQVQPDEVIAQQQAQQPQQQPANPLAGLNLQAPMIYVPPVGNPVHIPAELPNFDQYPNQENLEL